MKKLLNNLDYWFDFYIGYIMTNGNKIYKYHEYMSKKWGDRYK